MVVKFSALNTRVSSRGTRKWRLCFQPREEFQCGLAIDAAQLALAESSVVDQTLTQNQPQVELRCH